MMVIQQSPALRMLCSDKLIKTYYSTFPSEKILKGKADDGRQMDEDFWFGL